MENNEENRVLGEEETAMPEACTESVKSGRNIMDEDYESETERIERKQREYLATHKPKLNDSEFEILKACHSVDMKKLLMEEFTKHPLSYYDNTDAYTSYLD